MARCQVVPLLKDYNKRCEAGTRLQIEAANTESVWLRIANTLRPSSSVLVS